MARLPRDPFSGLLDSLLPTLKVDMPDWGGFFSPSVDIEEQDDAYVIKADLPGVKKEDVSVTLEDGVLTLRAERSEDSEEKQKGRVIRQERRVGSFARSFTVGRDISEADVHAAFKDGVLTLKLPKPREAESSTRRIPVK